MRAADSDILIVGGGTGGVAAALAATDMGCRVVMTEETDWIGGQLTAQAVPPDEHRWIEQGGCTARYRRFREGVRHIHPITLEPFERVLFPEEEKLAGGKARAIWTFRRLIATCHYPPGAMPHEVTLVNWPMNDYWEGNIIDVPEREAARCLEEARQLSLSLLYWLQTAAPRPDGGTGYPGLYPRPDITGAPDGLAKYAYIRESRRIRAVFTVTENHVGTDAHGGRTARGEPPPPGLRAEPFDDSVGIGCYRIDLHPSTGGDNYIDISSLPFQVPLGALIPVRVDNLLPACKNLGVTHITNGCYRLHPVEWNIGEAAGALAAFCLRERTRPRAVRDDRKRLQAFQALLAAQGVELAWPEIHPV